MIVRFFPFEMYHNKQNVGSTRIRVRQLVKYWPEAAIYKYGENPDVLIFQKVYLAEDYTFPTKFEGIKILDICDPDWLDGMLVKETIDVMDGITCPTEGLASYLRQLTDKPIKVIPDRHDLAEVPPLKTHTGNAKRAVWFGYKQNAQLLEFAIPTLQSLGLSLTVISNDDPMAWRWATDPETYRDNYFFIKYDQSTIYQELQQHDICVLPAGNRPIDRFKSNNKTTMAQLAGLPVAVDGDELRKFIDPTVRQAEVANKYNLAKRDYDCIISVEEMKGFIDVLKVNRQTT